jgi:hypothetical protein
VATSAATTAAGAATTPAAAATTTAAAAATTMAATTPTATTVATWCSLGVDYVHLLKLYVFSVVDPYRGGCSQIVPQNRAKNRVKTSEIIPRF